MTDQGVSGPTIKRYEVEARYSNDGFHIERKEVSDGSWVSFREYNANTQALRTENAALRERLRLAVEALNLARGYVYQATKESFQADADLAIIDAALRSSGVDI